MWFEFWKNTRATENAVREKKALKSALIQTLMVPASLFTGLAAVVQARNDVCKMRCNGVVSEIGDQPFGFQQKCEPPAATEENRQIGIYECRPEGSLYYVTFADGQVERIQVNDGDEINWYTCNGFKESKE
jgi:hypothetical protein